MTIRKMNYMSILFASAFGVLAVFAAGGAGYAALVYGELQQHAESLEQRAKILEETARAERRLNDELQKVNTDLAEGLRLEKEWSNFIATQFKVISGTVGALTKLSQTDRELLMKYSKVYFLNENYVPARLSLLDPATLQDPSRPQSIHSDVLPFLNELLAAAKSDGVNLRIVSAYRSFDEQESVKTGYRIFYGSGANRFSADQGYSEHQLASTVDFTNPKIVGLTLAFGSSPEYKWLMENAHRFGFILSYPQGNDFYQFEPWHWRFVGKTLASDLKSRGIHFYDMPQREINEYLVKIFD